LNSLDIGVVLLAAGSSSRMGQSKQMLPIAGQPLLLRSVNAALDSQVKKSVVVLGANEATHTEILKDRKITIIKNPEWKSGIGSSLKAGLNFLLRDNGALYAIIVLVCDQPLLKSSHINKLLDEHNRTHQPIVASEYANTVGVPAFFHKICFRQLLLLPDDQGAKKIIQQNPGWLHTVKFEGGEIDLDTMDDYANFIAKK
jgi:molybdenum cofactor cytidylyltransferase